MVGGGGVYNGVVINLCRLALMACVSCVFFFAVKFSKRLKSRRSIRVQFLLAL